MAKILLLQGANLTFLGRREPEIYGSTTPAELDAMLRCHSHDHAYELETFYTNIEGEAINRIYQAVDEDFDGLVMNPAGFTYAGFALKDCIKGAGLGREITRAQGVRRRLQSRSRE
jgi:3-dehydroquinate dehydratase II